MRSAMLASTSYANVTPAASSCSDARVRLPIGIIRRSQTVLSPSVSSSRLFLKTQKTQLAQQLKPGKTKHRARLRSRCVR